MKILFLTNNPLVSDPLYHWLIAYGEDVLYESKPIKASFINENNIGFIISYNYIHIIRRDVICLLPHRIINLHISFLPYNRGLNPNIWSFIDGTPSGVTIHEVDEGLDTGDVLIQRQIYFDIEKETLRSSYNQLQHSLQDVFRDNWKLIKSQAVMPRKQAEGGTMHNKKDAQFFIPVLNYDDRISIFLAKLKDLNR